MEAVCRRRVNPTSRAPSLSGAELSDCSEKYSRNSSRLGDANDSSHHSWKNTFIEFSVFFRLDDAYFSPDVFAE